MKPAIKITLFLSVVFLLNSCKLFQPADCPVEVVYRAWDGNLEIINGQITYIRIDYQYGDVTSAIPTGSTDVTVVSDKALTKNQLSALQEHILKSGFMELGKDAYGAPADQRYYPYELTVKAGCRQKNVIFRSNPSYEDAPDAFKKVENYIISLARSLSDS